MKEWVDIVSKLEESLSGNEACALATVIQVEGSAYRRVGARMLILESGNWVGSISGGCLEGDMLKKAKMAIHSQQIKLVTYDTRDEDPFALGIGLGCNGKIDILIDPDRERIQAFKETLKDALDAEKGLLVQHVWDLTQEKNSFHEVVSDKDVGLTWTVERVTLIEHIPPQPRIWIFGNQFDSHRLIMLCSQLAWKIMWVGNTLKMSTEVKKICYDLFNWEDSKEFQSGDYVVQMTHDLERDIEICTELVGQKKLGYWGILGPQKRLTRIKDALIENNLELPNDIHAPIGLDIGAEGPDEIAVSIVAEILAVKNQRNGQSLRNREGKIH